MPCFGIRAASSFSLCPSLSSVQMIVTLPVTFFFLNNSYNPGKTKLSGRGLGGNFKSLRFNFEEGPCRQEEKNFSMAKWLNY